MILCIVPVRGNTNTLLYHILSFTDISKDFKQTIKSTTDIDDSPTINDVFVIKIKTFTLNLKPVCSN